MPTPTIPGYRFYEYLLVLDPHDDLCERIKKVKAEFGEKYKAPLASSKAHVTLVKFLTLGMMEEKIIHRLHTIAMGAVPFKIELKDFGSFPSHTIYINITTKLPIQNLVKELKQAQRLMKSHPEFTPHFIMESHLTIARGLKPWQYEQGWLEYSHRNFTGRFIADSMLLLKRPATEEGPYRPVKRFEFENLPVNTKQGSLFL
ncbi:MAG: 2-5 ligase family protein [Flaviaesturariibacter sp.]|nr:2-5 ligase family protein [Flaviaesturariibacter sp.]